MLTKLTLTLSLLFLLNASLATSKLSLTGANSFMNRDLPLLNAYASKNGNVALHQDSYGAYYAYVDFQYNPSQNSGTNNIVLDSHSGAMTIGLYTTQTWLVNNTCMDFTSYNCQANSCNSYPYWNKASESLPYMQAVGYFASAPVYLDYNNWYLTSYAAVTNSCISQASSLYGYGRTGIVGMGANGSSSGFRSSKLFSIYLDKSNKTGQLQFETDYTKVSSGSSSYYLTADLNWHVNVGTRPYLYFSGSSTQVYYMTVNNMIFDLESSSIGFPYASYSSIISYFATAMGVSCTSELSYPTCYYYGTLNNLPSVYFYVASGYIPLPAQVYVVGAAAYESTTYLSTIRLNIRALAPNLSGINYVTQDYNSTIILGSSFMTYYYTVFQATGTNPTIQLYVAAIPKPTPTPTPTPPTPSNGDDLLFIILISVGAIAFIICVVLCSKYYKSKKGKPNNKVVPDNFAAPLISNADGMNAPYTQVYADNYQQQPQYQGQYYANPPGYNYQ